ncbi:MAG: CAP domain-containing protein [bacterium]|nr:CAP domain-containing protein [bacterium]
MMFKQLFLNLKLAFIPCENNNFRPKFLESRFLFYCAVLLLGLKLLIVPFSVYFPKTLFFADITKTALIEYVNQTRDSLGLSSLQENSELDLAAYLKAKDILEKDYFDHWSPEGVSPWHWFDEAGYNYKFAGENLAIGFLDSDEVYQAWLDSPTHKENILNKNYQEIGIAVLKGEFEDRETNVVVQLFGSSPTLAVSSPKLEEVPKEPIREVPAEVKAEEVVPISETSSAPSEQVKSEVLSALKEGADGKRSLTSGILSFFLLDYYDLLQRIIYGSLIFVILALVINIFVRIDIQHKDLILKTIGFIVLLIVFSYLDKGQILSYFPHNLRID